jgi:hypothetical protein
MGRLPCDEIGKGNRPSSGGQAQARAHDVEADGDDGPTGGAHAG